MKWIKKQLLLNLKNDDVFVASNTKQETVICRRQAGNKIIIKHFQDTSRNQSIENDDDDKVKTMKLR